MQVEGLPRSSKIGLACAGGVIEGAVYETGVIYALDEAIAGISFNQLDTYVGVSSGAVVGTLLANGFSPRTLCRGITGRARDPLLNFPFERLFWPAFREYRQRLRKLPQVAWEALRRYAQDPIDFSALGPLAELSPAIPVGVFDNEPLQRHLAAVLEAYGGTDDFSELAASLRVVAMHVDSAEVSVFGQEETPHVPITKAVQASTALPMLYCPVEIDGAYYIDGVARRTLHASLALDEGTDLLFCINPIVPVDTALRRLGPEAPHDSLVDHGLLMMLSQTFRSLVYSRMQTGFRSYEHLYPEADIILIEPAPKDIGRIFSNMFSYSNRHAVCEHAYHTTRDFLRQQADGLIPKLERHGLALRRDVLEDEARGLHLRRPRRGLLGNGAGTLADTSDLLDRLDSALGRLEASI